VRLSSSVRKGKSNVDPDMVDAIVEMFDGMLSRGAAIEALRETSNDVASVMEMLEEPDEFERLEKAATARSFSI